MKNKSLSLKSTTDNLSRKTLSGQEKNRLWWESLPMTYEDWDSKTRIPETREDFLDIERKFLIESPYIRNKFNFAKLKGKSILEIGCGTGVVSCLFAKNDAEVTAIDITRQGIDITNKNAKAQKVRINAIQQDAENLEFLDEAFDYVFSWGVLHHSKDTLKAFKQVARVLKKDGEGLIMVYNKNSARYYINGLYWLLLRGKILKGYNFETVQDFYTDGYYHRHFTPKELRIELEKNELKCTKVFKTHMGGYRMLPFVPLKLENWIKNNFGWLLVAEFKINKKDY
ncbi:MAG: class I SAM-dependent methyltransferase [Nanoarchaeota archaeon]|nr:class I SAM-dependent methyltransferase [Nanoarchaeota archaeon]